MHSPRISRCLLALAAGLLAACGGGGGGAGPTAELVPLLAGASADGRNLAYGISSNGKVIVGQSDSSGGFQAFRWARGSAEPRALGFLPGYTQESRANAANVDGSVIVGASLSADSSRAFIWTARTGMQPLGDLPDHYVGATASDVSDDGSVVVGAATYLADDGEELAIAFVWTEARGYAFLGDFLPPDVAGTTSTAYAVSADGEVVVGEARYDLDDQDQPLLIGFRWTRDTGYFPLGWLYDDHPISSARSVSSDGSVIGGYTIDAIGGGAPITEPIRWTPATSMVSLGRGLLGNVLACSADGTRMAGGAADPGTAFVWNTESGYRNLYGLLLTEGLAGGLEGHSPMTVDGMSSSGRIVVGFALGEGIVRGYWVRLP